MNDEYSISIFYDKLIKRGGAERILDTLYRIWPKAIFFTSIYDRISHGSSSFKVHSILLSKHFSFLSPLLIHFISIHSDIFISITSSYGKKIRNLKGKTICYLLTPTRYLWSGFFSYLDNPGFRIFDPFIRLGMKILIPYLRYKDYKDAQVPEKLFSISDTVSKRVFKYYRRQSDVIYPPVETDKFNIGVENSFSDDFFLVVSRFVPYKKVEHAILACNKLFLPLVVIGRGPLEGKFRKIAGRTVQIITSCLTDEKLAWYYERCSALIFPGEEDFGITAVEAQASGKPVIAYGCGGITEIVREGKTGEFFYKDNPESLMSVLKAFKKENYDQVECRKNALRFSQERFKDQFKKRLEQVINNKERKKI